MKRIKTNPTPFISKTPEFKLTDDVFESGRDSTILVRKRTRGSKLVGAYKKRKKEQRIPTFLHGTIT